MEWPPRHAAATIAAVSRGAPGARQGCCVCAPRGSLGSRTAGPAKPAGTADSIRRDLDRRSRNSPGSPAGLFQDPPPGRGARLFRARRSPAGPLEGGPLRPPRRRRSGALQAPDAKGFGVWRNGPPVRRREGAVRQNPAVSRNSPGGQAHLQKCTPEARRIAGVVRLALRRALVPARRRVPAGRTCRAIWMGRGHCHAT